jgi:hypothetical protein
MKYLKVLAAGALMMLTFSMAQAQTHHRHHHFKRHHHMRHRHH